MRQWIQIRDFIHRQSLHQQESAPVITEAGCALQRTPYDCAWVTILNCTGGDAGFNTAEVGVTLRRWLLWEHVRHNRVSLGLDRQIAAPPTGAGARTGNVIVDLTHEPDSEPSDRCQRPFRSSFRNDWDTVSIPGHGMVPLPDDLAQQSSCAFDLCLLHREDRLHCLQLNWPRSTGA